MSLRAAVVRLRIDARRPASWLALGAAAGATWWLAGGLRDRWPAAALVAGAAVAAAAAGGLPGVGRVEAWAVSRAAWPVAGAVAGCVAVGADATTRGVAVTVVAACGATMAAIAVATRVGAPPSVATATGLALAAACATAAGVTAAASPWAWPPAAVAAWGVAAVAAPPLWRATSAADPRPAGPFGGMPLRAAMVTALAAMAIFLFLAPELAWGYAVLAAGWLLVAALPRATLGPGPEGERARRMVTITAPAGRPWSARGAASLLATYAAVLVWPPLVAAALAGSSAAAAERLAIGAAIAAGAGGLALLSGAALAAGCSRDTALALALCAAVAAGTWCGRRASAPVNPRPGLMLSNPADPATLPEPRKEPWPRTSLRGAASCPDTPSPAPDRRSESRPRSCSC